MTVHSFKRRLAEGKAGEEVLDEFLRQRGNEIEKVSVAIEFRDGVDRIVHTKDTPLSVRVEYKTDKQMYKTGNGFIETISNDRTGSEGWAYKSKADYIFYFSEPELLVYILPPEKIRDKIEEWEKMYPNVPAWNDGYRTWGLKVPRHELESIAVAIMVIPDP